MWFLRLLFLRIIVIHERAPSLGMILTEKIKNIKCFLVFHTYLCSLATREELSKKGGMSEMFRQVSSLQVLIVAVGVDDFLPSSLFFICVLRLIPSVGLSFGDGVLMLMLLLIIS